MAIIQFENGTKVKFEGDPTPKDIEEVASQIIKQPPISTPTVSREPITPSNIGKPFKQGDSFLKSLIKAPIKSLLVKPTARATEALGRLGVFGQEAQKGYELEAKTGQDLKTPLGRYQVEPIKTGKSGMKQIAGEALESASWLIGGGGATAVGKGAVRSTIGRGAIQGAKVGAKSGTIFGAGQSLQEDEDIRGVIKGGLA